MNALIPPPPPHPPHSPDILTFINRLALLVTSDDYAGTLDCMVFPWLTWEQSFKNLCAESRKWGATVTLPSQYTALIELFHPTTPECIRITPRVELMNTPNFNVLMPLLPESRRRTGDPATVESMIEFQENWEAFTNGCFARLTDEMWKGMVVAGGAVEACLSPLPGYAKISREARKRYIEEKYPNSDIDIFFYGMSPDEIQNKIRVICLALIAATSQRPISVDTRHTITITFGAPYRKIQFVRHQYTFPAEILVHFDVDTCCCLFDGSKVFLTPRSLIAMLRQANVINYKRDRGNYELRLFKYRFRGYELYSSYTEERLIDPITSIILKDLDVVGYRPTIVYPCKGMALLVTIAKQMQACQTEDEQNEVLERYSLASLSSDYGYLPPVPRPPNTGDPGRHDMQFS